MIVRTLREWQASALPLDVFLEPGDVVDIAFLDYVLGVLPPAKSASPWLAMGEAFDHDRAGRPRFLAFRGAVYQGPLTLEDMA